MEGFWLRAIEGPGNHLPFSGVGARSKGAPGMGPKIVQEPKQDV